MRDRRKTVTKINETYVNEYQAKEARQRRSRKRLIQRLVFASVIVVLLFGALFGYHLKQRKTYANKQAEHDLLSEQIVELEQEKHSLLEEINLLKDDEYILDIARTNYFLSKEGELIFQIEDENEADY